MLLAILVIAGIAALAGWVLMQSSREGRVTRDILTEKIDNLLPQTQCEQCGYPGCRPYAKAIASGAADINRCPPGGRKTIRELADLLGRPVLELDPDCGRERPFALAVIEEDLCIGCTLCIKACPVDAILGASKQMHTVIASECTGCELCIAPCPVDCIDMVPVPVSINDWQWPKPDFDQAQYQPEREHV